MEPVRRTPVIGPAAEAIEFVRFCYHRRRVGWPELYDEMCAVAVRGLFRGWSVDDLAAVGVGFSLFEMPALAATAALVIAEETAAARQQSQARIRPAAETPKTAAADSNEDGRQELAAGRMILAGGAI